MTEKFLFEYQNEAEFKKLERSVKKYNMLSYKKLYFDYYPSLRAGTFLGDIIVEDNEKNTKSYELKLPTDMLFIKVHGRLKLKYTVYIDTRMIVLQTIEPEKILLEGHQTELSSYKGVMVSNNNSEKDKFKINLLNSLTK